MADKEICSVKVTGGQVDELVMALIDAAQDKESQVKQIIATSLLDLGKKQTSLVLTSCLVYLQKHNKLAHGHRVALLRIMENILKDAAQNISVDVAREVIKQASHELTYSKEVVPEWHTAASSVLVAMGTCFCNQVMEELLLKFQPGVMPHFFVVETIANLAMANVFGMVPFLKGTLGSMLPMLGMCKADNMRWALSTALARFSEAILDYLANIEKAPDPAVTKEAFETEITNAFDVLLNVWIHSKESKLRVAVVEALGQMSQVMAQQKLQEHLQKLLQAILSLYKKHPEPYHITQGLCMILDAATCEGNTMLEPHFDQLNGILFPQVCVPVDYSSPMNVKNHNEILRCYAVLARSFSDRLVAFLIQKLEPVNEKTRIGVLSVLRHLINSAVPYMENKKALVLSGLQILLNEQNNKVKKVLAQTVIAMAHHSYLELEGGQLMVEFIIQQCSLQPEPQGKRPNDPEYISNEALKSMCDNVLQLLATTVDCMARVLWPYLLEFITVKENTPAVCVLCQSIAHIAGRKREEVAVDFLETNFTKLPNIPKPSAIFARLIVLSGYPSLGKNRGTATLQALRMLGPVMNEYVASLWDTVIPKLIQHLEDCWSKDEDWNQKTWEDLLLKFVSKSLDQISDDEWVAGVADSLAAQIPLYGESSEEKNFLYKCLGLTLKMSSRKDIVSKHLDTLFGSAKHSIQMEREGCAMAVGFTASSHLDLVLSKLEVVGKMETAKRSSGFLGFIKESVSMKSDVDEKLRATVMLSYAYVTMYAPPELIISRLEAVIARVILPQFEHVKDAHVKQNLILAVELIGRAMHPDHLGQNYPFSLRNKLLQHMQAFIKAEKNTSVTNDIRAYAMNAAASLVKLDPPLLDIEVTDLVNTILHSVMPLPPGGSPVRKQKEETYNDHIQAEQLLQSTLGAMKQLLVHIMLKILTPAMLENLARLLHSWSVSQHEHERERAVDLMMALFVVHYKHLDPVKSGCNLNTLGYLLGWLIPRCSDTLVNIRKTSLDAVQCLLKIAHKYEDKLGKDAEKDVMIEALPTLKDKMERSDSVAMFAAVSDLAKVVQKKTPPVQLMPLLESLFTGLLDPQAYSSSGVCVVMNSVIKARGGELHSQVESVCGRLLLSLEDITYPQTRTGTLRCIRTLASHHLMSTVNYLLQQPLPLSQHVDECWRVLGQDNNLTGSIVDQLLESLSRILPYDERPDPRAKDTTMRVATVQTMAITCALTQLCQPDEVQASVINSYPRLLSAMMLRIASTVGTKPPKVTREDPTKKPPTVTREVQVDPCVSAILGCQQVIRAVKMEEFTEALDDDDVWTKLGREEHYDEGFTLFARYFFKTQPEYVSKLISSLLPSMGSVYEPQRVMAAAVFAELISHKCAGDLSQVEMLTTSFLSRLVDNSHRVRMLCIRGLGNIAAAGPEQVQKHSVTVLSAMMSGMDDKEDRDDDITLEAMEGLSKILAQIDEGNIRAILINIALRIRPCFEKEKPAVRAAAIKLFGNLSRFGDGPSKEPFLEQIHTNLVNLLLHLNDPDPDVIKTCKSSLRQLGPLLGSDEVNKMFQKHLIEDGSLLYGDFLNSLSKVLLEDFPEKSNFYIMGAVNFFKSSWPEIRANAAVLTGVLLGHMPPERYIGVSKEHVCSALVLLLKDPSADVRIKAAEAMSWLYDL